MIKWFTILLALAGASVGLYTVATASSSPPKIPLAAPPSINPFPRGIAATGVVEGVSRNINIVAPEGGLVTQVFVQPGQQVQAGAPLFELDLRPLQAEMVKARSALDVAQANLDKVQAEPRAETIPPLEAGVNAAQADLADWKDQYESLSTAMEGDGASRNELQRRLFQISAAEARLALAEANLKLTRAGAWEPDKVIAHARVSEARAAVDSLQLLLDRRTVRTPIDATVLKRDVEPGQWAPAAPDTSAIVIADLSRTRVRARIDEEDLPKLRDGSKGEARVRGDFALTIPLKMIRIEPFAIPKTQLSGATNERVDTRVVEVIFEVDEAPKVTLFPGQLVDVFIDVPENLEELIGAVRREN